MPLDEKGNWLTAAEYKAKNQTKKQKVLGQLAQTAETQKKRQIKNGDDIALKKVNSVPSQVKRGLGSLATGVVAGVPKMLGNTQNNDVKYQYPLLSAEKRQSIENELRSQNTKDIQGIRNAGTKLFNLQGTRGEDVAFGLGEAIAPTLVPGGLVGKAGKTVFATDGLSKLGTLAARGRQGGAIGLGYTGMAEESPDAEDYTKNAALFGAFDVGAAGIGMAGKNLLGKLAKPKVEVKSENPKIDEVEEVDDFFDLEGAQGIDFTADQFGNVRRGESLPELPAGRQPLALPEGNRPLALTGNQPLMLQEGKVPNWEYWKDRSTPTGNPPIELGPNFYVDQYGNIRTSPETPLALPAGKGEAFVKNTDDAFVPRSDIGDPQYIASLEQRYKQMVDDEVKNLKDNSKLGVEQPGLGFSDEGEVVNRWGRMSNNPEWYRKIFAENATEASPLGKEPRSGQYRDQALKNLIEGNAETGEPASEEFNAILSELARGQKLPEEWHGLQKSIKQLENDNGSYIPNDSKTVINGTKVVDKNNNPLVVYHGTRNVNSPLFSKSDKESIDQYGRGVYFTEDKNYANMYSYGSPDAGVIEAHLDIQNPYDVTKTWKNEKEMLADPQVQKVLDYMDSIGKGDWMRSNLKPDGFGRLPTADKMYRNIDWQDQKMGRGRSNDGLKQAGFDGIISEDSLDGVLGKHYIVFNPSQIKKINPALKMESKFIDNEVDSLFNDMKSAQKQVEPYGLNKNLDRLTELENQARQRMKDRADFRKQYPDAIGIVAKNPLDDIKDLTIIGATKIAKGSIEFAQWSKEMIDEFGQIIEKQLPGIWKHSNLLVQKGETVLKYKGNEMPVKWQAAQGAQTSERVAVKGINQAEIKKPSTNAGEANAVKWREGDPLPAPQSKIVMQKPKEGFDFKGAMNKFYTHFVNTQQAIVNTGKVAGSNLGKIASNTRNASGIVDHNFLEAMVDKNGKKVGASLKEVAESIPKGKEEDFWTYMSLRHNIDRAREGKPVQTNYSPEMSAKATQIAESQNPEFKAAGDAITQWIDKFMQTWGVDTGIVNKDVYTSLREMYPSYFPTQREFSELEKSIPDGLSQKFADLPSPIRKAKGSDRDITNPLENIMQLVSRTIRTAKYNEVGQSLLESVNKNPEKMKPLAETVSVKDGMFANTDNIISVLVDGKPKYLQINDKALLDAMNGLPKRIHDVPFVTALTQAVKNTITQKNPLFAIRNIMRDVPTSYVYGSESNPLKFARDLGRAGKDIATNSERFQQYKGAGGGGANFFSSGDVSKAAADLAGQSSKLGKIAKAPLDAIAKFNNLTETAPRLAEFNRVLDKTGDVTEALYAAGEVTVNFSRSGNVTKAVDKLGGMYVNASVQGIDRFFRGFKDPKVALATLVKGGIAITAPDIALYLVNKDNPNYKAIDNRNKDTYFMIPNLADKDENGNAKTFIKVPKSRELGVLFGSLLERVARAGEGQKDSFKGFANTVATNFAPANPLESNLITPAAINIPRNKDFADRPIVPLGMEMDNRPAYLQYDEKSTEIAKKIGELTKGLPGLEGGLSPKQIDYLVKSYTGVIAQIGQPLATKGGGGSGVGKVMKNQFVADPLFSNQSTTDFYDKLGKLSTKATEKNIKQNIPSEEVTPEEDIKNSMNAVSQALSRGTKQINKINATTDPDKEAKVKAIKKKMLFLTEGAVKANTPEAMQAVEDKAKELFPK